MADIEEILTLEQLEKDIFRGNVTPSNLRRTFGGQVAGQSLVSAVRTVDPEYLVHSLHGYFLRPGNPNEPTVFLVDRVRDGRSFCTRRVTAIQDGQAIFSMSASFQTLDSGIEHQDLMPPVPDPDELPDAQDEESFNRDLYRQFSEWDIRIVPDELMDRNPRLAAQQRVWFRCRKHLPDDPVLHICALAYMSDLTLLSSSKVPHRDAVLQTASLDHALWFLRPFRADEWLLYDETSPSAGYGRALTQGRIFDREGRMVAAVVQEGLTRYERNPDEASIAKGEHGVSPLVGVLALQGDVREHVAALKDSGADAIGVRRPEELDKIDGLVIPGGESTTMSNLLRVFELLDPLTERLRDGLPVYGSCAGMILLASEILDTRPDAVALGAIDMTVRRNAFGRQVDSFEGDIDFAGLDDRMHAVFIRAPWVERVGEDVEVLASAQGHPVAVRQGNALATAFHPEVTGDRRVHELFVDMVRGS